MAVGVALLGAALLCGCYPRFPADDLRSSEARQAAVAVLERKAQKASPPSKEVMETVVSTNRPKAGYYFTVPPGYVYSVKTNGLARAQWLTNGPLLAYMVHEYRIHGDHPHQFARGVTGPYDAPASNSYCWKWSETPKWAATLTNWFITGHVEETNYLAYLPQYEVSYATNWPN